MNHDRRYKHQQQRVQDLIRQVEDLESENEMLNKEIENLYQINDIRNQELADTREACELAQGQFSRSAEELKALQRDYKTLLDLMTNSKQHYEKAIKDLLQQLEKDA